MDILNNKYIGDSVSQVEMEMVEKEKKESIILGTYNLKRGLKLFYYNPENTELGEVEIKYSDTLTMCLIDGEISVIDLELMKCTVDSRFEYFQCLNMNTAKKRLKKFKLGKIKELFNLKEYNSEGIRFW